MMQAMRYGRSPGWTTLLVLGMLLLRALVPAGFMLAPVDGSLAVVLCNPQVPAGGHQHAGHDHAAHQHGVLADPTCPYAQSTGPGPLPTLPVLAGGAVFDLLVPPAAVTQTFLRFGPTRQQTSRGPPYLA
jgi:hypothetical protein